MDSAKQRKERPSGTGRVQSYIRNAVCRGVGICRWDVEVGYVGGKRCRSATEWDQIVCVGKGWDT
jgi:hypothetical protein